jgi:lipopolysaccharide export LptBFGC system permease protein LptF
MVFVRYFFTRFFKHFFFVAFLLAMLFNLIEFFEKLMRVKHAQTASIMHFIGLNLIPSFFDLMPLASWLATCLLIRELYQQNEWDIIQMLSIGYKKIGKLFVIAGLLLALTSMVCKEYIVLPIAHESDRFKQETFKQQGTQKMVNSWMLLEDNLFCNFSLLDLSNYTGRDLLFIFVRPDFSIDQIITAPEFQLDAVNHNIFIKKGVRYQESENRSIKIENVSLNLPSFFSHIAMKIELPSLSNMIKNVVLTKKMLPDNVHNELLHQLLKFLLVHLQLVIYPIFIFCLFVFFLNSPRIRWAAILVPYPLFITISASSDYAVQHGISALVGIVPYVVLIAIIAWCWWVRLA